MSISSTWQIIKLKHSPLALSKLKNRVKEVKVPKILLLIHWPQQFLCPKHNRLPQKKEESLAIFPYFLRNNRMNATKKVKDKLKEKSRKWDKCWLPLPLLRGSFPAPRHYTLLLPCLPWIYHLMEHMRASGVIQGV